MLLLELHQWSPPGELDSGAAAVPPGTSQISPPGDHSEDDGLTLEAGRDDVEIEGGSTLNIS